MTSKHRSFSNKQNLGPWGSGGFQAGGEERQDARCNARKSGKDTEKDGAPQRETRNLRELSMAKAGIALATQ